MTLSLNNVLICADKVLQQFSSQGFYGKCVLELKRNKRFSPSYSKSLSLLTGPGDISHINGYLMFVGVVIQEVSKKESDVVTIL